MVFWITFKQMFLYDYFRPGDITILKSISKSHCYEESHYSNIRIKDLFEYLNEKMKDKNFRFMKVSEKIKNEKQHRNTKEKELKDLVKMNNMNSLNGTDEHFLSKKEKVDSFKIKLFKLSDIFQYLSVIEIVLEECSSLQLINDDKNNNNNHNNHINDNDNINTISNINKNTYSKKVKKEKKEKNNLNYYKTKISFRSVSVSILPAFFPLGFIFGFLFLLIPFSDFDVNKKYIKELKNYIFTDYVINSLSTSNSNSISTSTSINEIINENTSKDKEEIVKIDMKNEILSPYVPPSTVFFLGFIVFPVFLAAAILLFS